MYKPGDIILVRSRNWFGNLILLFMRKTDNDAVHYAHSAVIESENTLIQARLKIERTDLLPYLEQCKSYKIIRYKKLTEDDRICIIKKAIPLINTPYGIPRLLLFLLDKLFETHMFTKLLKNTNDQVCSSFVAWLYSTCIGCDFNNVSWCSCDPDDIEDHVEHNPDDWEIIDVK